MARGLMEGDDLLVHPSSVPKIGNGLFTKIELDRHTFLGEYVGEVISADEFSRRRKASYDAGGIQ